MNCDKCGMKLENDSNYCPNCGRLINKIDNNNKKLGSDKICMIIFVTIIVSFILLKMVANDFDFRWFILILCTFPFIYDKLNIKFNLVELLIIIACIIVVVVIGKNLSKELSNRVSVNEVLNISVYKIK